MKTGKEIPESSRLEFLEKFLANNFALSDAEDSTSGPSNRGVIADLPLLRTLLAIHQKFLGRDGLFCFSSTWKFSSFKNPFAMIASLSELYFRFRRFILLLQMEKNDFYELLQQLLLKTMELSEFWTDTYNEGYMHQFQPGLTHKIY